MKLKPRYIGRLDYYRGADDEAFELSLRVLQKLGYSIDIERGQVSKLISNYDKFAWRAGDRALASVGDGRKPELRGYDLVHQAVHTLVAHSFGEEYEGRPLLTLLSESLAGATEAYYELAYSRKYGWNPKSENLLSIIRNAKRLGAEAEPILKRAIEEPFQSYKQVARAQFAICQLLLEQIQNSREIQSAAFHRHLVREIKKVPQNIFVMHKDYGNFMVFTLAYCGRKSTREDLNFSKKCLKLLDDSTSMTDLLERLGARDLLSNRRAA